MKKLLLLLSLLSFSIAYTQPQILIEGNDVYDWGKVNPKGKPLTAKVKIYNKGNEVLIISEVKPGCGCTTAPLDKNNIEPNGFATLSITLNINNDGPVTKSIRISSNDPKTPTKNLLLKADIFKPISVFPKYLNFGDLVIAKETIANIQIKNNTNKIITIKDIIKDPTVLVLNIKKNDKINANATLNLLVKYTPDKKANLNGKLVLKTDNKEMDNIEISIFGRFQ